MLFNSLEFFVFLACVYVLYRILPFRWQNWMLLVAGYVFYGFWDVRFLFLIAFSTTVDFSIGMLMADRAMPARHRWTASLFLVGAAFLALCPNCFDQIEVFTARPFGFGVAVPSVAIKPTTSALLGIVVLSVLQVCDYRTGRLESFKRWPMPLRDDHLRFDH